MQLAAMVTGFTFLCKNIVILLVCRLVGCCLLPAVQPEQQGRQEEEIHDQCDRDYESSQAAHLSGDPEG